MKKTTASAKPMSSYSKKEIEEFQDDFREVPKWGMYRDGEYVYVPLDRLKPDHIQNIMNDYVKGIQPLGKSLVKEFTRLLKIHKLTTTKAGKILYGKK